MTYLLKPLKSIGILCLLTFFMLFRHDVNAQDIILFDQNDVDSFYPGSTYTGNIRIGKGVGGGSNIEITNLFNLSVLKVLNGTLTIAKNLELENLDDLTNLTSISESLLIYENEKLIHLDGLSNLEIVNGSVEIYENDALKSLVGLDNLTTISDRLYISHNISLLEINHFSKLSELGHTTIGDNDGLIEINGLQNIDSKFSIFIWGNLSLKEIKGFSNISKSINSLTIAGNDDLDDISGFNAIDSLDIVSISVNDKLENLDAFQNLVFVRNNVTITHNVNLTNCCGIYKLLSDPFAIGGEVDISSNPSACSSQEEVLENYCGLQFNVSTNPTCVDESNGSFQIDVTSYDTTPFHYQWERLEDGQTDVGTSIDNYFTIDMLEAGTYNIIITTPKPDTAYRFNIPVHELDGSIFEIINIESTNSTNGLSNGSLEIIVSGSLPPFNVSWSGPSNGSLSGVLSNTITIPFILAGEYTILIEDSKNQIREISLTLLDETVPVFPCTEPLDIVILNDVSGSVDTIEYQESKDFFVHFLEAANIGLNMDESRAAIIEWSNETQQEIKIPITGDIDILREYKDAQRSFFDGTVIHNAMEFGSEYLDGVARPDVPRVMILATDGSQEQVPGSLIALADQFKVKGYHILTIAFDEAYSDIITRDVLYKMASIGALAPGAPAYSDLDENLAENIVNSYLCPIDPGETSNVYFSRDGSIDIIDLTAIENCIDPKYVDVTFTIEAFRELSIPGGTFVTFYLNNPEQFGATKLLTWQIPCSIAPDSSETFITRLPINGPSHIYAVLNDDGESGIPISFPITDLEEVAYSNNIDDEWICIGDNPSIQALKYSTTPSESCDTIINYTINVCNISLEDATGVIVTDQAPDGFVLVSSVVNLNDCAIDNNGSFDIPGECCLSISLTYDASGATLGYYGDQDVLLDGPMDQDYFGYDGSASTAEDVILDGTIDCPSTIIEFKKEVNVTESCDDAFLTFTFTINNELNYPLQGLIFTDIVPLPSKWVFEPYNISGLSIGIKSINQNNAQFIIDEVDAATVASFSFDLSLNMWNEEGTLLNSATLDNVPDAENGGTRTLISNTTTSQIFGTLEINFPDTITIQSSNDTINLDALYSGSGMVSWTSEGDGTFTDSSSSVTQYILGSQDLVLEQVLLNISIETECDSVGQNVLLLLEICEIAILEMVTGDCDDNGTPQDSNDDTFSVSFIINSTNPGIDSTFNVIIGNDTIQNYTYDIEQFVSLPADGIEHLITFVDSQFDDCIISDTVIQQSCSDPCALELIQLLITDCNDNGTPEDNTDDSFTLNFTIGAVYPGLDSIYSVIIGNDTINGYAYYEDQMVTVTASNSFDAIQFVDSQNDSCSLSLNVGIENCVYPCDLTLEPFEVSECNDNGTPDDDSDDTFTVSFNLFATYSGLDSTYFVTIGNDTLGEFPYDSEQVISLQTDGQDYTLNFVDSYFSECILTEIINVESCSNPCAIRIDQFDISECDDNTTSSDSLDDIFTINFNISALNSGDDSTYFVLIENDTLGEFPYDSEQTISLQANGIVHIIHFVDSYFTECMISDTVNIESCSNACDLSIDQFIISECDDNGTVSDYSDDTFTIIFTISTSYPSEDSTYFVLVDNDTLGVFPYYSEQEISLIANGEDHIFTFVDSQFSNCSQSDNAAVENCSDNCELFLDELIISECDDNETPEISDDDTYMITFNLSAENQGLDSLYYARVESNSYGPFSYGMEQSIILSADGLVDSIHFMDSYFEYCLKTEITNLEHCSDLEIILDDIAIPNIFSPNDDGINDNWSVKFYNGNSPVSCQIYDRWGNLIYLNESETGPNWDGSFNGKMVNSGVFVYKLIYRNSKGESTIKNGDVTVIY